MAPSSEATDHIFQLPISVIGRVDIGRLIREVQALDNFLSSAAVRQPGTPMKLPRTSKLLDEMVQLNKLNMLVETDRNRLHDFLESVHEEAPVLHMSFSADPSPLFAQRLVSWLRSELHPLVLLQIGLQPSIGAGTVVRTTNKYFDFSLRQRFHENRDLLINRMKSILDATTATPNVQATPMPAPTSVPVQSEAGE